MSVRVEHHGPLAEVVLSRPEVINALDASMVAELHVAIDDAESGGSRAVLVRGEGRGFSAGRDLTTADPLNEDGGEVLRELFNPLIRRIADLAVPTFAAVHGACLGVGFGIAMACDVIVCAETTRIGSPFARIGAVLDSGGHAALVHRVGPHRALELIYTGRLLTGPEAAAMGLVNACVPDDDLVEHTRTMATTVADGPTASFARSKAIVRRILDEGLSFADVLATEAAAQSDLSGGADYAEGMTAFLDKRPPVFRGR